MHGKILAEHLADQGLAEILRKERGGDKGGAEALAADFARRARAALGPSLLGKAAADAADRFSAGDRSDCARVAGIEGGWDVGDENEWKSEFGHGISVSLEPGGRLEIFAPSGTPEEILVALESYGIAMGRRPAEAWRGRAEGRLGRTEDRRAMRGALETLARPATGSTAESDGKKEEEKMRKGVARRARRALRTLEKFQSEHGGDSVLDDEDNGDPDANLYLRLVMEIQDSLDGFPEIFLARLKAAAKAYLGGAAMTPPLLRKMTEAGFNVSDPGRVTAEISPDVWICLERGRGKSEAYFSLRRGVAEGSYERLRDLLFEKLGFEFVAEDGECGEDDYLETAVPDPVILDEAMRLTLLEWGLSDAYSDDEDAETEDDDDGEEGQYWK